MMAEGMGSSSHGACSMQRATGVNRRGETGSSTRAPEGVGRQRSVQHGCKSALGQDRSAGHIARAGLVYIKRGAAGARCTAVTQGGGWGDGRAGGQACRREPQQEQPGAGTRASPPQHYTHFIGCYRVPLPPKQLKQEKKLRLAPCRRLDAARLALLTVGTPSEGGGLSNGGPEPSSHRHIRSMGAGRGRRRTG